MRDPELNPQEQLETREQQIERLASQLKPRFIKAARKVQQLERNQAKANLRTRLGRRWVWAPAALLVAVLAVAGWLYWPRIPLPQLGRGLVATPAIAEPYPGFDAVLISSFDRHVVAGVEALEVRTTADGTGGESLRAISNSQGLLSIPPDNQGRKREYVLRYRGQEVGRFDTGLDDDLAHGTHLIMVAVPPERLNAEYQLTLKPGERKDLEDGLYLSLSLQAPQAWTGTVVHDGNWPAIFNYGNVLEGIFSVDGPLAELKLGVKVSRGKLELNRAQPAELELISQSNHYFEASSSDPDPETSSIAVCHRGWYNCGEPPRDYLPQVERHLQEDAEGTWVSWTPAAGAQYAILLPPEGDWQAGVVLSHAGGEEDIDLSNPFFVLLKQRGAGNASYFYDVEFSYPTLGLSGHVPGYPLGNWPQIPLDATLVSRGYQRHPEVKELLGESPVPGEFYMRRFDFTTQNPELSGPLPVTHGVAVGSYSIEFGPARPGEVVQMRLTGNLDRIVGQPAWDLDRDGNPDAWGMEAELLVSKFGSYDIYAIVEDQSGQRVMVNGLLEVPREGIFGFTPKSLYGVNPVMSGVAECPDEETSFWIISHYAMGSRATNSEHVSSYLGPRLYLDPPPEFDGKSIAEIRLVLYASPRGGDTDQIFIVPLTDPVAVPAAGGELKNYLEPLRVTAIAGRETIPVSGLLLTDLGYPTMVGLQKYRETGDPQAVLKYWKKYLSPGWDNFIHEYYLGFTRNAIPSAQELVDRLQEFRASPYYPVRFVTTEHQELVFRINGYGLVIEPDMGFVVGGHLEDQNEFFGAQYEVYSGGRYPARVELETTDGALYTRYLDYSVLK